MDRKKWKEVVSKRMRRIELWEWGQGHQWNGERVTERNVSKEESRSDEHVCEVCGMCAEGCWKIGNFRRELNPRQAQKQKNNCQVWDSNWGPLVCKTKALPLDHGGKLQRRSVLFNIYFCT